MPELCDRSVCAAELHLRNTVIQKVVEGWTPVPAPHLTETVSIESRIGNPHETPTSTHVEPDPCPYTPTGRHDSLNGDVELEPETRPADHSGATPNNQEVFDEPPPRSLI